MLVTGREPDDLRAVFAETELFDALVVENGAVFVRPADREVVELAPRPPEVLVQTLVRSAPTSPRSRVRPRSERRDLDAIGRRYTLAA